ncbi:MAG: CRISPR-associated CARF protein Csa3 [Desulfurococcaceae archaeon]
MPRVFIAPIGFHEDFVLRSLIVLNGSRNDVLLVLSCIPILGGVRTAIENLAGLARRQGLPDPQVVELECSNLYHSLRHLRGVLKKYLSNDIVLIAGGGLRALTIIAIIALISYKKPFTIHYEPETDMERFTVKPELLVNIYSNPGETELRALEEIIKSPGLDVKELAHRLGLKEKSTRNLVTRLKKRGLVVKKGRREGIYPTDIALALYS